MKSSKNTTPVAYAIRLLKSRDYTETEIRAKLDSRKYGGDIIIKTVDKLKELGFINDRRYLENYIEFRLDSTDDSVSMMKYKLLEKGVKNDIIEELFNKINNPEQVDAGKIKKIIAKKVKSGPVIEKNRVKLYNYLISKGFDEDLAEKSVNEISR